MSTILPCAWPPTLPGDPVEALVVIVAPSLFYFSKIWNLILYTWQVFTFGCVVKYTFWCGVMNSEYIYYYFTQTWTAAHVQGYSQDFSNTDIKETTPFMQDHNKPWYIYSTFLLHISQSWSLLWSSSFLSLPILQLNQLLFQYSTTSMVVYLK